MGRDLKFERCATPRYTYDSHVVLTTVVDFVHETRCPFIKGTLRNSRALLDHGTGDKNVGRHLATCLVIAMLEYQLQWVHP